MRKDRVEHTARAQDDSDTVLGVDRRTVLKGAMLGAAGATLTVERGSAAQTPEASPAASPVAVSEPTQTNLPVFETWDEPWIWRPSEWPNQSLDLNVVENENPGPIVGFGNPSAILFSYNGSTPGPTIRMQGDETLRLTLRNQLGRSFGTTNVGPYPDPNALPSWVDASDVSAKSEQLGLLRQDFCLGEHTNGVHSNRVTNIHSHGLHVRPGRNPDGTHSDNVILRLIDQADYLQRQEQADSPACEWLRDPTQTSYLRDDETTGYAEYEFRIGNVQQSLRERLGLPPQPHPPGTHWYHPHSHGATHNQVASGMAGFLIIEGDVDEAVNMALTGEAHPDPQLKTGDYDYLERVMLVQRVFVQSDDPDAPTQELKQGGAASPVTNGDQNPAVITMRPGAIERWRVLNGSVDGRGYKRVMVLRGQYQVVTESSNGGQTSTLEKLRDASTGEFTPASRAEVEADKVQIYQLAFDGVTLVEGEGSDARYTIQDLAEQNAGTVNPLARELTGNPNKAMLANIEAAFADAEGIRNCFVRPNEVYMAPANRTDILFQAPRLQPGNDGSTPEAYTVLAHAVIVHGDNYQSGLMNSYTNDTLLAPPEDIVIAHVVVSEQADGNGGDTSPIPDFDIMSLVDVLPPVPEYLLPISHHEVRVKEAAGDTPADPDADLPDRVGKFRTRTITYSGWGAADYPLVTTATGDETAANFRAFIEQDQENGGDLELLRYAPIEGADGEYVLLPPNTRSMGITGSTSTEVVDLPDGLQPVTADTARKFNPTDPQRPRMLQDTAEEWALYSSVISLWADTSEQPLGQFGGAYPGQPLLRGEGQALFAEQPDDAKSWMLQTKGVDHPFHIHQNPVWVMRIEVPDENGNLVNVLDQPRWQDVVWIPRNGGRVIFRSRFPDFIGVFVNHCHILLHEDNGMMQVLEITPFADQANYELKDSVADPSASDEDVSAIYPRFDQARAWRQSMTFYDSNHGTGQVFPGFELGPPPGWEE